MEGVQTHWWWLLVPLAPLFLVFLLPRDPVRLALRLMLSVLFRTRVEGLKDLTALSPKQRQGVLLVPNHVDFVDALLIAAYVPRRVRFVAPLETLQDRSLGPLLRALGAVGVDASAPLKQTLRDLRKVGALLRAGEVVCVYAGGELGRRGVLLPFQRGVEHLARGTGASSVPVWCGRAWSGGFSATRERAWWTLPDEVPQQADVWFGSALADDTDMHSVRRAVADLGERAWQAQAPKRTPLHHGFVKAVRRRPWRRAVYDPLRGGIRRYEALVGAIALARAMRATWQPGETVGVLLPPSVAGVVVQAAAALAGRTIVNLNYTAGPAGMGSAARQANLTRVLTSKVFLQKARLELPTGLEPVWAEDVARSIGPRQRLAAVCAALCLPIGWLERYCGAPRRIGMDDVATIIFSSGSTGEPKGVPLTHRNLDANLAGVAQVVHLETGDCLLGILPLFHSFGYFATWFALENGIGLACHANPLDVETIGRMVSQERVTILIATPTFLSMYTKKVPPEQFASLRIALAGAERLTSAVADAFEDRFGLAPIEGYGATECAPVIAVSVPAARDTSPERRHWRRGSVGHPLLGVAVRVVDPDTGEGLPHNTPGMLLVKGANVMSGYLGRPDLTAEVLQDGWYRTGDIARIDLDGYVWITDRLSRFSKIAGEMVPHGRIEETLHAAADAVYPTFAVTALADERRGERLVVLHTADESMLDTALAGLSKAGLPNLWIPRREHCVRVTAIPVLGTGKLDLRALKHLAQELTSVSK
jgi:acyl-[acyl-carrier-protein]-phospholipid O-acyltransferase/long-chain-fatty-acid--[acyl-carrier-protein] ligase